MIRLLFSLLQFLQTASGLPLPNLSAPTGVDFRYYQSPVRALPKSPQPFAYAVCDLMETFTGIPSNLNPQLMLDEAVGKQVNSNATFYQFMLEEKGLYHKDAKISSVMPAESFTHYLCPKGTVLSFQDASRIQDPGKVVSLLNQGMKGIVVSYAFCAKDWKKGKFQLDMRKERHQPKTEHTVLIVGYQDSTFIFKNNWSSAWGDHGYGTMSFGYHQKHAREGLVAYLAEAHAPEIELNAGIALKTQPEILDGKTFLQVSLIPLGPGKLPAIQSLSYTLQENGLEAKPIKALILQTAQNTGYPCLIPLGNSQSTFSLQVQLNLSDQKTSQLIDLGNIPWANAEYQLLAP